MYRLAIVLLLATVISVHSNVSSHYFWKQGSQNKACNWTVYVFCENNFVIDIQNVTVSYNVCNGGCSKPCADSDTSTPITVNSTTTIQQYIMDKCHHLRSCETSLPYFGDMNNWNMTHVTVHYNCTENTTGTDTDTDTYTSKGINSTTADMSTFTTPLTVGATENTTGSNTNTDTSTLIDTKRTTVAVYSSPSALTNGDTENTTGSDANTDTSTLIVTKRTTVAVYSSPPALTDSETENTTGSDANTDTSTLTVTTVTTFGVYSSPATHADDGSSKDPGTEKQSSSLNIVFVVVPTVLLLVAITLVTVIIIARQKQRRTNADDKTAIHSEFDTDMLHDGASSEATPSLNVNGIRNSRMAYDNDDYNTINLITFPVTSDPTYNHVNLSTTDPQYGRPNESPLVDSDYASCADIDETAIQDHPYSHIINNTHTSNEINSNQGLTAKVSRSDYDHIELHQINGNHIDESTTGDSPYSHTGTHSLKGRFLFDVDQCGDYYSHIGQVGQATDANCSKDQQREVAEARFSSYIVNTCETGTASKVYYENTESRDIHDWKEDTCGNVNVNELNGGEIHPLYQVTECDDSCDSSHSYFILKKFNRDMCTGTGGLSD